MFGKSTEQENDALEWQNLSPAQKDLLTNSIIKTRQWKFKMIALATVFSLIQAPISNYYANRTSEKQVELSKLEKVMELQGKSTENAVANLLTLSSQIGEMKVQNELLKARIVELETMQLKLQAEKDDLAAEVNRLRTS